MGGRAWSGAEIDYVIAHWSDQDARCADLATNMALATGLSPRTGSSLYAFGRNVLGLGLRPKKTAWPEARQRELKRLLLCEGLTMREAGIVLGTTKNAVVGIKNKLGLCERRATSIYDPHYGGPTQPRTPWAERPFPGVITR